MSYTSRAYDGTSPNFEASMAKVANLSQAELQDLLNDENRFEQFLQGLDPIQSIQNEKALLTASIKSLAEYNLTQEPVLRRARGQLESLRTEACGLLTETKTLRRSVDDQRGQSDPDTLLALLQTAAAEEDEASETVAQDFVNGEAESVDKFLEVFMEKRRISHLRRVKADKLKEMMEARRSSVTPTRRAPPPPAIYNLPAPSPSGLPYPVSGLAAPSSSNHLPYPMIPSGMPFAPNY
eukprot:maker-scaffold589_size129586-snap-gene-0.47 protein:Tk07344 transcript:maker-scaffold589_size129586-snap-gene-0.47-mRNA-1 annotation:"vacuolar protein-sorting"